MSKDTTDFRPLTCQPETGKRTELNVPFRKKLPRTSLVSIEIIRCVCPDATHMITRCVETDLRKMAKKITLDMHRHKKFPFSVLRKIWPDGAQPLSNFTTVTTTDKAGKVGAVSFSGFSALTVTLTRKKWKRLAQKLKSSLKEYGKMNCCSRQRNYRYVL